MRFISSYSHLILIKIPIKPLFFVLQSTMLKLVERKPKVIELNDFLQYHGDVQTQMRQTALDWEASRSYWKQIKQYHQINFKSFDLIPQLKTSDVIKKREHELWLDVAHNTIKYYQYIGFRTESEWWEATLKSIQQYAIVFDKTIVTFDGKGDMWVVPANMDNMVVHEGIRPAYDWKFEICRTTKSGIIRQRGGENGMNSAIWCKIRPHTYKEYVSKFFAHLDKNEIVHGAYTDENIAMDMIKTAMHLMGSHKVKWIIE
jgi:hypothetical protein